MAHYRAYAINEAGDILHGTDIAADDDDAAWATAQAELAGQPGVELWSGVRRIGRRTIEP